MAIGIDELDFDDEYLNQPVYSDPDPGTVEDQDPEPEDQTTPDQKEEKDVVVELLKKQGIEDPTQINFENEDGSIEKRDWKDLTPEEQLNILSTREEPKQQVSNTPDLGEDFLSLAQELKDNNMSVDDFVNYVKNQGAQEFQASLQPHYEVDNISDDELYKIDLKNRIPDITPEQLETALEQAKSNEELYSKQVNGIREEYKQFEEEQKAQNEAITAEEQQQKYNEFANSIANSIDSLDNINGIDVELEDEDKYELAQFILGQDAAGVSNLGKALNDPETLVKVAWFALKGADAIDSITDYFKNEIAKVRESSYKKGLEDASGKKEARVVITKPQQTKLKKYISINDLD